MATAAMAATSTVITRRIVCAVATAAMVIAGRVIRAVAAAAVVVSWLGFPGSGPPQRSEAHAGSQQGREAHHGLPPGQRARCFVQFHHHTCLTS
jgi:hypothetical protein